MRKTTNMIEYSLKGELTNCTDEIILTQIVKKDDVQEDTLDLSAFKQDIIDFCNANLEKNIELKFSLKTVLEGAEE